MDKKFGIIVGLITAVILIVGVFLLSRNQISQAQPKDMSLLLGDARHYRGTSDAKVSLVEVADFQCPACSEVHPLVKQLLDDYKGKIFFVYRHFPLAQHANAFISAEASEAAGAQGKFWEMYDILYTKQKDWENSTQPIDIFTGYAKDLGLNTDDFKKALVEGKYKSLVQKDIEDVMKLGLTSTPTFYINGYQFTGSFNDLKKEIDKNL